MIFRKFNLIEKYRGSPINHKYYYIYDWGDWETQTKKWSVRNQSYYQGSTAGSGAWIPDDHHLEGLSYSSVLVKSWLGRFVRVAGIFQVWTEFLFYFLTDYLVDPRGQNLRTRWSIFNRQVVSHQIIVKSVVVVVSSGATSISKCVRGRVKSSFLLNLISFGIFVRFSH